MWYRAGIGLSISAIAGIAVAAALVMGVIAGGVTYSVSNELYKPYPKLVDKKTVDTPH